jgi:hypothetical protein
MILTPIGLAEEDAYVLLSLPGTDIAPLEATASMPAQKCTIVGGFVLLRF